MIIERKTNIYDAINQIVNSSKKNVNLYTRAAYVREVTLPTYNVELITEIFDVDNINEDNLLYNIENIQPNDITVDSYVYITYITSDIPVIFNSLTDDNYYLYVNNLLELSGTSINIKTIDEASINLETDIDIDSVNGDINLESSGSNINLSNKITIENGSENLGDLLQDLISEIQKITVPTPAGTSGPPINIPQLIVLGTKLSTLLG